MPQVKRDVTADTVQIIRQAQAAANESQMALNALCAGVLSALGVRGRIVSLTDGVPGRQKPFLTIELPESQPKAAKRGKEKPV